MKNFRFFKTLFQVTLSKKTHLNGVCLYLDQIYTSKDVKRLKRQLKNADIRLVQALFEYGKSLLETNIQVFPLRNCRFLLSHEDLLNLTEEHYQQLNDLSLTTALSNPIPIRLKGDDLEITS